ncbi:hypothetical protein RND71_040641 [Anisodus tanguticus]|uniref:DUF1985 domain-containing protein n=1 Tax=Anisodus tanguticus TaxID=243964 RepID=A0AAE1QSL2_9SOLA|nr:hypothetical protein RND71_040641 [Anisodus tanguticus]
MVSGAKLHFGLGELALITGLKCKGGTSITVKSMSNQLVKKYFKSSTNVTWSQVEQCFKKKCWKFDANAVKNVFPSEDERLLLDLEGLAFEPVLESSQSQRISDGFFCTQAPKADMG